MEQLLARIERLAEGLPGVTPGTSYGNSALKVAGRTFVALKAADLIVLMAPIEEKERLMEMAPDIYFETDHYKGWPALLVRAGAIGDEELGLRLTEAWRAKAPARLRKSFA